MLNYWKVFCIAAKSCVTSLIISLLCLVLVSLMPIVELNLFNNMVNELMLHGMNQSLIYIIILYFIFSLLLPALFHAVYQMSSERLKYHIDCILASNALQKTVTVSVTNIESGEGVNNAYRASQTQSNGIVQVLFHIFELVFSVVEFITIIISMQLVGIGAFFIIAGLIFFMYRMKTQLSDAYMHFYWDLQEEKRYHDCIFSLFLNREYANEIKQYRTHDWLYQNFKCRKDAANHKEFEFEKKMKQKGLRIDDIQIVGFMLILLISCILIMTKLISPAFGITCIYAGQKLIGLANQIVDKINNYNIQKMIIKEYNKLIQIKDECTEELKPLLAPYKISVRNLKYRYPNGNCNVLDGLNFDIKAGEKVVLVGANGSGKSTLIRLLLGFDEPNEGEITVNGEKLKECLKSVREETTFMRQGFFKYDLSLRDNIIISDSKQENNSEQLVKAIAWAEVEDLIEKLENKLDTEIVQGGKLSGGEWQKVALARMRYRSRRFIIMDEPNSAIDVLYELKLYKKMMELGMDNTMIIVSHRLPICQMADKIIVMDQGKIIEMGSHQELMALEDGYYRNMFYAQAKLYAKEFN